MIDTLMTKVSKTEWIIIEVDVNIVEQEMKRRTESLQHTHRDSHRNPRNSKSLSRNSRCLREYR